MSLVRAKKHLGQHFLTDKNIAAKIVDSLRPENSYTQVLEVVGMFQKEVAERCSAKAGSKEYGILSVFLQAYYKVEYLFTVKAGVFNPPPKVLSAVIRLTRNNAQQLNCDEKLFWQVVKAGFNQRRKTLRNAVSSLINKE